MDEVFSALDDPSRRRLLDELLARDGQTLAELCAHLPNMTRYGVMNHLRVLEAGGLVVTKRVGRHKYHYLNPVPIRLVHDRWITKFTAPAVGVVAGLKTHLESDQQPTDSPGDDDMNKPVLIHETYIRTTPEEVWSALTDPDRTPDFYHGTRVDSSWQAGDPIRYLYADGERQGQVAADGQLLAVEKPKRLELTFHPRWSPEMEAEGPAHMVWVIEPNEPDDGTTRVRVEYYDIAPDGLIHQEFGPGTAHLVAGLKTLLETGTPMVT